MKKVVYLLFILLSIFKSEAQLSSNLTVFNVRIDYTRSADGSKTDFVLTSAIGGISPASAWLGIGFNENSAMSGASVVVCSNSPSGTDVVHRYMNIFIPDSIDSSNPRVGISNANVTVTANTFRCSFTRNNNIANNNPKYFDLNAKQAFVLAAYGKDGLQYHGSNRGITGKKIDFTLNVSASTQNTPFPTSYMPSTMQPPTLPPSIQNFLDQLKSASQNFLQFFLNLFKPKN